MAPDAAHPTRTRTLTLTLTATRALWGDLRLGAVACEGSRLRFFRFTSGGDWIFPVSRCYIATLLYCCTAIYIASDRVKKPRVKPSLCVGLFYTWSQIPVTRNDVWHVSRIAWSWLAIKTRRQTEGNWSITWGIRRTRYVVVLQGFCGCRCPLNVVAEHKT